MGDWVEAIEPIPVTLGDHLLSGAGIAPGTRGVVIGEPRGLLNPTVAVRFDTGIGGTCQVDTPLSKICVRRRAGGVERFTQRSQRLRMVRLGVAVALCAPLVYFIVSYLWTFRTVDGLLPALASAALDSAAATVEFALTRPLEALVFLLLTWGLGRFAFR